MTDLLANIARKAAAEYVKYFELLDRTGWRGNEPYDAKEVDQILERLAADDLLSRTLDDVTALFAIYAEASRASSDLEVLHGLAVKVRPNIGLTFSSSGANLDSAFHRDVRGLLKAAEMLQNKYNLALEEYHPEVDVFSIHDDVAVISKRLETAQEIYQKFLDKNRGQLIVDMYVRILQIGLGVPPLVKQILHELEDIKTSILATAADRPTNNRKNGIQQLILTYNLRPIDDAVYGLDELFAMHDIKLGGKSKLDIIEASKALCKLMSSASSEYKYGIIVVNRAVADPVIYKLPQSLGRDVGPSVQNIAGSVSIVPVISAKVRPVGITKISCQPGAMDYYFVVDVVADGAYRWLSPYGNLDKIPARMLAALGDGSSRVRGYNDILSAEIFKQMDDPLVIAAEVKPDTYWKNLRGRVLEQVYARLGSRRADAVRLADLITSVVVEQLQTEMMDVSVTPLQQRQYVAEMRVSVEASKVELNHKLVSLLSSYTKIGRDDVSKTLDYVLTSKSNLYRSMEIKNQVLSATLLHSRFGQE